MTAEKRNVESEKQEIAVQESGSLRNMHINADVFCDWQTGRMGRNEEEKFLEHIGVCTFCAQRFGDWMEKGVTDVEAPAELMQYAEDASQWNRSLLSEPPAYLKEEILQRSRQIDVQASMHIKETSHKMQLLMYSLKVGLAVMASIFLLMVTSNIQNMDFEMTQIQQEQRADMGNASKEPGITDTLKQKSGEISAFLHSLSNGLFRIETEETKQEEIRR